MEAEILAGNLEALRARFPALAGEIGKPGEGAFAPGEMAVERAASGDAALKVRGVYVHSPRDPVREARRLAETLDAAGQGPVVVMGFGLGYGAEAAAEKAPGRPLIVIEKHRELFRKALETRDLRGLLSRGALVFVFGGGAAAALSLFPRSGSAPDILRNRALTGLDAEWYAAAERDIAAWAARREVNRATLRRFGRRWVRNLSRSLAAIRDAPGISRLAGLLAHDIPVFLAAGGPSLDLAAPLLGDIRRRCLIVAVDTSLRFLLDRGTAPDFVVSVDPQYWNFRHLDRQRAAGALLVAESAVYPPCLRHPFAGVFLCSSLYPLGRFIEDRVDPKGELGAGGSVASAAWDFSRLLGPASLWIAGLDLGFPGLRTHFKGALFEDRCLAEGSRLSPPETWSFRALRDGQPFAAQAADGGAVLTDRRLALYASWFESRFRQFPALRNYRLDAPGFAGLAIEGLESAGAEALLALPPRRDEIDRRLEAALAAIERDFHSPEARSRRAAAFEAAREALVTGLGEIGAIAGEAARTAEGCLEKHRRGRLGPAERERAFRKLDDANAAITRSGVKDVAGFLFPAPEELREQGRASDGLRDHLEFSRRLYRALEETAADTLAQLRSR
ncbi:MAG: DUF115 domain-containing protein [Treponematales bacterium]